MAASRLALVVALSMLAFACGGDKTGSDPAKTGPQAPITTTAEGYSDRTGLTEAQLDKFDPYRGMFRDITFDEAYAAAAKEQKLVVFYHHAESCEHCRSFEENVLFTDEVKAWLKEHAVLVRNRNHGEGQRLFETYSFGGGLAFPSLIITRHNGDMLKKLEADLNHKIPLEDVLAAFKSLEPAGG
ncbi:MAG: thioredoxin family protein [Planctomycetes bacterium]|nr:thioredoxin family protein [Planctomycetota bacterium]